MADAPLTKEDMDFCFPVFQAMQDLGQHDLLMQMRTRTFVGMEIFASVIGGIAHAFLIVYEQEKCCEVYAFGVREELRRKSIATHLFSEFSERYPYKPALCRVPQDNFEAISFLKSLRFEAVQNCAHDEAGIELLFRDASQALS